MFRPLVVVLLMFISPVAWGQRAGLKTVAETSGFQATGTYSDVITFCEELAKESQHVHLMSMGKTHESRDIPLLVLSDPPVTTPEQADRDGRPVFFAMANIHAGEVCGKEATQMLARDLARADSSLLKELIIVFAPIYNADGNERFSTRNRPGQIGPARGMGQRPNAMGLDLNRDHMKLESPEARALAKLMTDWKPVVAMDLHTTDGSFHRFRLTYDSPRHPATDTALLSYGRDQFLPKISEKLKSKSGLMTFYYGNFDRTHESWHSYPAAPRYSTHYFGLRNCLGILSEAYAYSTYEERIVATYEFVRETLQLTADNKKQIAALVSGATRNGLGSKKIAVRFRPSRFDRQFTIPGYKEDVAGRGRARRDSDEEQDYSVDYFGKSVSTLDVERPYAYLIPAAKTKVIANLQNHGVRLRKTSRPTELSVQRYTIKSVTQRGRPFQGHRIVSEVNVQRKSVDEKVPQGTILVTTDQPLARLIVNLLEPQADDGLFAWNFLDEAIEPGSRFPIVRLADAVKVDTEAMSDESE